MDSERVTVTILDGGAALAAGVSVTIFRTTTAVSTTWRCQFDQPQGVKFQLGRYYRIRTDDGRTGACICSGVTGSGIFCKQSVVKMTGMGPLK